MVLSDDNLYITAVAVKLKEVHARVSYHAWQKTFQDPARASPYVRKTRLYCASKKHSELKSSTPYTSLFLFWNIRRNWGPDILLDRDGVHRYYHQPNRHLKGVPKKKMFRKLSFFVICGEILKEYLRRSSVIVNLKAFRINFYQINF